MGNRRSETRLMPFVSLIIFFFPINANSIVLDYISPGQSLSGNKTIVSKSGIFELGFFKPENSKNYYIGIWSREVSIDQTVVWVANRDGPINDPSISELKISEEGNLVLLNHLKIQVWSTESDANYSSTLAVLLDTGNLVLTDGSDSSAIIWQSFDYPTDTWLPGANLTVSKFTNKTQLFTSWRSLSDPAPGDFSFQISQNPDMQDPNKQVYNFNILMYKHEESTEFLFTKKKESTGFLTSSIFVELVKGIEMHKNEHPVYFTLSSSLSRLVINHFGDINQLTWLEHERKWSSFPAIESYDQCEYFNPCGAFTSCNWHKRPHCTCLLGFEPRSPRDWSKDNWSGGCVRTNPLSCDINSSGNSGEGDGFVEIPFKKFLPADGEYLAVKSAEDCRLACLGSCSCTAYAYYLGKYYVWRKDLWNVQIPTSDDEAVNGYVYLRLIAPKNSKKGRIIGPTVGAAVSGVLVLLVIVLISICRRRRKHMIAVPMAGETSLVVYKYRDLQKATKDFSEKLGGGSFGSVFKGALPNSTAIAVKRLEGFRQGDKQFRSEVSTIGMIQHNNVLRLWGFCSEGNKKLLVYDYMKNGSLESHLFHQKGSEILEWKTRLQIAIGTARGLAYLHEECRECIIHCDIKPENILLDANFQPKVADFGMAKLLGREFSRVLTTMRGTIGYLAPEWISGSAITPKADVYSYGMMLLEIISGRRNTSKFDQGGNVGYFPVWAAAQLNEGEVLSLLDYRLEGNADLEELTRACRVACWCIQDDEAHRPSMGKVVQILEGVLEVSIPPISSRLLNLVADYEDKVFFLESLSDQSSQLQSVYAS